MKVYKYILLSVFSLLILAATPVFLQDFNAEIPDPTKNEIQLTWIVQEQPGVMHYTVKRKMIRDSEFVLVNTVQPKPGLSNPKEYVYIDKNVFRNQSNAEPVLYHLYVNYTNGDKTRIGETEVNYSSTAIRRTWGSIKAMFQ
jgi:hypothetical protein